MAPPPTLRVICVTSIFPPDIGGPATYLPQICEALSARGHRVTLVTLSDSTAASDGYPFQVVRVPRRTFRPWRSLRTTVMLARLSRQADVLFVHGLALEAVLSNVVAQRPLVHKIVGDLAWERSISLGWVDDTFETFQQRRYGLRVQALKALRTWWSMRSVRIIVPSMFLTKWIARWGVPPERLIVIPNAVEVPSALTPPGLPLPPAVRIAVVGRLVPWKHVEGVLQAVAEVEMASVVIIGDGPGRQALTSLVSSLAIADRVLFAGPRSHRDTLALMSACDLFVLNSTYEGFPHVVLEAMCLGLPVIATAAGGTPELVREGENGLLVAPGDRAGLRVAIARLVDSPAERQRLAEGARRWAAQASLGAMVDQTESVLRDAARLGGRGE